VDVDELSDADLARIKCVVAAELNIVINFINLLMCYIPLCKQNLILLMQ
jgi:hypothetical protein